MKTFSGFGGRRARHARRSAMRTSDPRATPSPLRDRAEASSWRGSAGSTGSDLSRDPSRYAFWSCGTDSSGAVASSRAVARSPPHRPAPQARRTVRSWPFARRGPKAGPAAAAPCTETVPRSRFPQRLGTRDVPRHRFPQRRRTRGVPRPHIRQRRQARAYPRRQAPRELGRLMRSSNQ